jgi:hypothetical protein
VEKGPDRVVSENCAAIGEVKLCLCQGERGVVIIVEWVRVDGVFFACANCVDLVDKSGEILGQAVKVFAVVLTDGLGTHASLKRLLEVPDGFISS